MTAIKRLLLACKRDEDDDQEARTSLRLFVFCSVVIYRAVHILVNIDKL